jgi:glutamyl-tRNA reductase
MNLIIVGLSHKTAPIDMREKLAFPEKHLPEALTKLLRLPGIKEGLILSTCNRVEVYAQADDCSTLEQAIHQFFASYHKLSLDQFASHLYTYTDQAAVQHIFRVAASLDSMVVGEPQILGQLKDAYQLAQSAGTTGILLNNLLPKAFGVAKKVRTETGIAQNAVSVSFAAVELAKKIFDNLQDKIVMIIGAGEMSELVAQHLISNGVKHIFVSNRTHGRAVKLAEKFSGQAIEYERILDKLYEADIIISSTGAPHSVIKHEHVLDAIQTRKQRPMFLIDIAVPRDVDPRVNQIDNVYLYDIDDLQSVVEANIRERQREAKVAEDIINKEVNQFCNWLKRLDVAPTIVALRKALEDVRRKEVDKALGKLRNISEADRQIIEGMTQAIINKILHQPISSLKHHSASNDIQTYINATRKLFNLKDQE